MSGVKWVLVAYLACSLISYILRVGKPRKPITPSAAALSVVEYGALIALVVIA